MNMIRWLLLFAAGSVLVVAGCATDKHDMVKAEAGQVSVCTRCYDEIRKARSLGGPRGGLATNRTITTHLCEDCKDEMTISAKDGVLKIRCPTCSPEDIDCDRCVPKADAK